ncbi:CorA metal ion transporter [Sporothrix stenoceras]|uniref:CorA metal ion transporter n=1 Tax=Sporothrix stenoceras TaxID=5173 RepID=A0ABR3Z0P3_9PEZI
MSSKTTASPSRPPRPSVAAPSAAAASASQPPPQNTGAPSGAGGGGGGGAAPRKRHKHRGGKKKQRRKSFAVVQPHGLMGDDDGAHDDVETDPLKDTTQAAAAAASRDEFFDIHHQAHRNRSLSTTSLDSESLLDHRDQQPFLRARRPSIVAAPSLSQSARLQRTDSNDDSIDEANETAPLLSQSYHQEVRISSSGSGGGGGGDLPSAAASRAAAFGGYGTTTGSSNDGPRPPSRHGSNHSGRHNKFLNPFSPFGPTAERYSSVNYPPSVPGSPPLRPTGRLVDHNNLSFGDQMLRDELRAPSSPSALRRSDTSTSKSNLNDMLGDRERERERDRDRDRSREQRGRQASSGSGGEAGSPGSHHSHHGNNIGGTGVGGGGEDDVCFPQGQLLSEMAEDEDYDRDDSRERDAAAWRTRNNRRRRGKWPDLAILDEWSRFEKEGRSEGRRATKKIKEPQLINGRLRPVHKGWHRAEEDAPYRFTYFNEEFQSTIHSQSISELVQPGGSFRELFIPDPPVLSDSESDDDEAGFIPGYEGGDGSGFDGTTVPGYEDPDTTSTAAGGDLNLNLSRDPLYVAEALSNAGDSFQRPGTRSGGSVSPEKDGSGTTPRLGSRPQLSSAITMERSATQASEDFGRPTPLSPPSLKSQPSRVTSPPQATTPDQRPLRTMSPGPVPLTLTPQRQAERENLRAAVTAAAVVAATDAANAAAAAATVAANELGRASSRQSEAYNGGGSANASGQALAETKPPRQPRYGERPVWWLDVLSPTEAEMKILSKAFGIHPLTAEDIVMQEAREKVELFHHYYFVSYRSFDQDPSSETFLDPVNMYVVVFREGVLSFHFSMTPHPANVRRRIRQLSDYMILSSDWISYAIIDDITDVFVPLIQKIEEEVDDIDDAILQMHSSAAGNLMATSREKKSENANSSGNAAATAEADTNMLLRVGDCRKRVMSLYRLLGNKADVIKGFAKRCNEHWEVAPRSEIGLYLGDIQDHIVTMTSNLSHYEKILSRAHGNYLAQINIRMNERQEQTADVLGKLTVLGTIVLPMNIITGLWGMNVWVPGQDGEGDLRYFVVITAGLLAFGMACYWIAKRVYKIV